ncbi:MAG: hypothetical protein AAGJ19_13810 [Myxococcota bacterium]
MSEDGGSNQEPGGQEGATPSAGAGSEKPSWFKEHESKVEAKLSDFGRQFAKVYEKIGSGDGAKPKPDDDRGKGQAGTPDVGAIVSSAMKYSVAKAQLPEAAQKQLDKLEAEGKSFEDLAVMAEAIAAAIPSKGDGQSAPKPPPGKPGTGANNGTSHPRTWAEFQALSVKAQEGDAKAQRQISDLMQDDEFDPQALPLS